MELFGKKNPLMMRLLRKDQEIMRFEDLRDQSGEIHSLTSKPLKPLTPRLKQKDIINGEFFIQKPHIQPLI